MTAQGPGFDPTNTNGGTDVQPAQGQDPGGERKPRRQRKPIGPDANGLGPDGQPWDPTRRAKRLEERQQAPVNSPEAAPVEAPVEPPPVQEAPKE